MRAIFWSGESRQAFRSPVSLSWELFTNAYRTHYQVPLILAWAISIHKSQGQTIQRVKVDLGRVFEKGQSYVALSRAAAMDGLQVLRFDPKKVPLSSSCFLNPRTHSPLLTLGLLALM